MKQPETPFLERIGSARERIHAMGGSCYMFSGKFRNRHRKAWRVQFPGQPIEDLTTAELVAKYNEVKS